MYLSLQRGGWLMQNQLGKLLLNRQQGDRPFPPAYSSYLP
jgi:hypothetical protein